MKKNVKFWKIISYICQFKYCHKFYDDRLNIVEILWKPKDCWFMLAEELYRIPCLYILTT